MTSLEIRRDVVRSDEPIDEPTLQSLVASDGVLAELLKRVRGAGESVLGSPDARALAELSHWAERLAAHLETLGTLAARPPFVEVGPELQESEAPEAGEAEPEPRGPEAPEPGEMEPERHGPEGAEEAPVEGDARPEPAPEVEALEPRAAPPDLSTVPLPVGGDTPGNGVSRFPPFRDQDTGLHSRAGFDAIASGELKRCRRHGRTLSLLLIQLGVRDLEGLVRAAAVVHRELRESDLAGRHIDRTLAVVLPETPVEVARGVAARLVAAFDEAGAWGEEGRIGIAALPVDGETLMALLDTARGELALPSAVVLDPTRVRYEEA